uniref:Uncharacterized protein n=1 Tax=Physcomitrium patens TaxID=3218 RepID=A0A7I4F0H6_PHYPA
MPKGSGLPLCMSGVCIMTRVPDQKTSLCSTSSRFPSLCRGSSATMNFGVRAALNLNATESRGAAWMVELDRQRESLRKRRLVQGLGSFLEEQAFMLLRQSRLSQEDNRSLWQELIYAELYASDSRRLGHCGARAA